MSYINSSFFIYIRILLCCKLLAIEVSRAFVISIALLANLFVLAYQKISMMKVVYDILLGD